MDSNARVTITSRSKSVFIDEINPEVYADLRVRCSAVDFAVEYTL